MLDSVEKFNAKIHPLHYLETFFKVQRSTDFIVELCNITGFIIVDFAKSRLIGGIVVFKHIILAFVFRLTNFSSFLRGSNRPQVVMAGN